MTIKDWVYISVTLTIALVGGLASVIIYMIRGAYKWARTEERLRELVMHVKEIVDNNNRSHEEIYKALQEDRRNADRRLRWLEENLWRRISSLPPETPSSSSSNAA